MKITPEREAEILSLALKNAGAFLEKLEQEGFIRVLEPGAATASAAAYSLISIEGWLLGTGKKKSAKIARYLFTRMIAAVELARAKAQAEKQESEPSNT